MMSTQSRRLRKLEREARARQEALEKEIAALLQAVQQHPERTGTLLRGASNAALEALLEALGRTEEEYEEMTRLLDACSNEQLEAIVDGTFNPMLS